MRRRNFGVATVGGVLLGAATYLPGLPRAESAVTDKNSKQSDYVFWLSDKARSAVKDAALLVVAEFAMVPLDEKRIAGVYQRGSMALKARSTEANFVTRVKKYHAGAEASKKRVLQSVEGGFRSLPNCPDGRYAIAVFDVMFGSDEVIYTEQVTFAQEVPQSEEWNFSDYYLAPKPFYSY